MLSKSPAFCFVLSTQSLTALATMICLAASLHNVAQASDEATTQEPEISTHQSTTAFDESEGLDGANDPTLNANVPMCYLKAHRSFEQVSAKSVLSLPVKTTAYSSLGVSVTLLAPTLGASFPLGLLASIGSLAVADLSKQSRLGDRERFMGIVLEAAAYKKQQQAGFKPAAEEYPLMRTLQKRVNGFFQKPNNLPAIANTINQLESDPDFCNDVNNMRFVHLKDRVLEKLAAKS